ncbi:MAG: hypothetical protein KAH17_10625 [Bacteroidales bacterium]|nr:hypothetical protein [Bacteroidales bacterium]
MNRIFTLFIALALLSISCKKDYIPEPSYTKGIYNENGVLKYKRTDFYGIGVNYYKLYAGCYC